MTQDGHDIFALAERLFPLCRSLTGDGNRETLAIIGEHIPLTIHEVASGTPAFDWQVPREWNIRDAYLADASGARIVDFKQSNLHVVGYSTPIDTWLDLDDLQPHLHSLEDQPDAIPYITSYYAERWGFCLSHNQRQSLKPGKYHAVIDSELSDGHLTYAEYLIPGETEEEIFLATNICHPSLANNEISGPAVLTALAKWLASVPRRYSYRIAYVPETIGAIVYLNRNLEAMKSAMVAGYQVTCVGDDRSYSYLPSRTGDTLADRAALHVLENKHPDFIAYSFLDRGSDERQYCSVGADLPVASLMRSKHGAYPEYHTSLDDLSVISPAGLFGSFELYRDVIELMERNVHYRTTVTCEPQLSRRGLYPTLSVKGQIAGFHAVFDFIAYADGSTDLIDIAAKLKRPAWELYEIIDQFCEAGLVERQDQSRPAYSTIAPLAAVRG